MLRNAVYIGQDATTLTITGLNSASAYDIYIAGFSSNYPSGANFSTSNTTSTLGTQTYLSNAGDQSSAWVQGQNYVLFEDVVPDESDTIVINSTKVGYSFFSGFQVVESIPEPATILAIANFSYDASDGSSEVRIAGEASTRYKLVEAADLDFANPDQDPIPLTGATVGTLDQDGVVTDINGDSIVQFNLGTTMSATFLRAEEYPQGTGAELDLLSAVRGGYSRKVVIIGTSLSHADYGDWPALMESWLKGEAPDPTKVTVVNLSESGSNTQTGGINKLPDVKAQNPDVVFIEFGINDAYTFSDISVAEAKANLNYIIDDLEIRP